MSRTEPTCQDRVLLPEDIARDDGIATGPMCGKPATCRVCDPVGAYACDEHKCRCRLPLYRAGTITAEEVVTSEVRPLQARIRELENWADHPLPEDAAIAEAFPTRSGRHDLYAEAMRLVGAKRSKGALVALVNWLLHRAGGSR